MTGKLVTPRLLIVSCLLLAVVAFVSGQPRTPDAPAGEPFETRCGWFSNPTPANASLFDREAEWIVGVQGGHQAQGDWPDFKRGQWVETNGHYGYGCACLRLRVSRENHQVSEIESARARPLAACRRDRSLKRWDFSR